VTALTLAALLAAPLTPPADANACLPVDAIQRVAAKALRGDYDPVPGYIKHLYLVAQQRGLTVQGVARLTTYCPRCSGMTCADGSRVRDGICAANPQIAMHSWVWLECSGWLKVCDRGGWVTLGYCRYGQTANVDEWLPGCVGDCWRGPGTRERVPYAVLPPGSEKARN